MFRVTETDEGNLFSDALEIHTLELPKLRRQPLKENWEALECWCLYLNNMEGKIMEKIAEKEPIIKRAMTIEDVFTQNEEERRFYELREKGRRDYTNAMLNSERRGEQRGRLEGRLEGKQEGRLEGELKGKLEVARTMLANAMSLDLVSRMTGLSAEEIEALR